jgi:hypothetical protein
MWRFRLCPYTCQALYSLTGTGREPVPQQASTQLCCMLTSPAPLGPCRRGDGTCGGRACARSRWTRVARSPRCPNRHCATCTSCGSTTETAPPPPAACRPRRCSTRRCGRRASGRSLACERERGSCGAAAAGLPMPHLGTPSTRWPEHPLEGRPTEVYCEARVAVPPVQPVVPHALLTTSL